MTVLSGPAHGTASVAVDGRVSYTPLADYAGTDTFTYKVSDGLGGTATATVTITVTPVNDPPVAADDSATVAEDASVNIPVLANDYDIDGDPLTPSIAVDPDEGTATVEPDGTVTYVPHANYFGTDTFTYTVSDGNGGTDAATVTVTVTPVPDAPVARPDAFTVEQNTPLVGSVLANDSDEDGDVLTVTGTSGAPAGLTVDATGKVSWIPTVPGSYPFSYTMSDGSSTASATVTITVTAGPITSNHAYLNPTNTLEIGKLTLTAPSSGGLLDWDADLNPGFTIRSGGTKVTETDPTKFHMWQLDVPAGGLSLNGPVTLDLWTSLEGRANKDLDYSAWLYECDSAGNDCTLLASTVDVHIDNWSTTTTWEKRTVSVGSVSKVIPGGNKLRIRLGFNHSDVWIPLDEAHPSSLVFTTGG